MGSSSPPVLPPLPLVRLFRERVAREKGEKANALNDTAALNTVFAAAEATTAGAGGRRAGWFQGSRRSYC